MRMSILGPSFSFLSSFDFCIWVEATVLPLFILFVIAVKKTNLFQQNFKNYFFLL